MYVCVECVVCGSVCVRVCVGVREWMWFGVCVCVWGVWVVCVCGVE